VEQQGETTMSGAPKAGAKKGKRNKTEKKAKKGKKSRKAPR
jgi:hypothetical protein